MVNVAQLQQEIREFAASIGIDKIGFTTAAPLCEIKRSSETATRAKLSVGL